MLAAARTGWHTARPPVSSVPRFARSYHGPAPNKFLKVSEEIREAVAAKKPVVALESTIYTHGITYPQTDNALFGGIGPLTGVPGFPYPDNIALASLLESVVRVNGGVPATIGVHNGIARVGLDGNELIELAESSEKKGALKVSRRDLGYICGLGMAGRRLHGGTTISGTMVLAQLAGIKVFGTGGLGGVHRGGENSMDVSADLTELGRTPVTVISSGCKSFLDIPRTLEYLETEGVCIATFADGRQGPVDFPAFFSRDSGVRSPKVIQDEAEAAAIIYAQSQLPVSSGMHFANPVPLQNEIPKPEIDKIIEEAVRLADIEGHHGSDNTPFVLAKIQELSGGKSVAANRALVESNVKLATKVAVQLSKLEQSDQGQGDRRMPADPIVAPKTKQGTSETVEAEAVDDGTSIEALEKTDVLVAGSLAVDLSCDYTPPAEDKTNVTPTLQTSNPAVITQSLGGVGYNVAIATKYLGSSVLFCSVVGDDLSGHAALTTLQKEGLNIQGVQTLPASARARTAQYIAVNDAKKDLHVAMADMGIMELPEKDLNFEKFWEPLLQQTKPRWVVIDANWSPEVLAKWVQVAKRHGSRVAFEPVSAAKSRRIFLNKYALGGGGGPTSASASVTPNNTIDLAAPNQLELATMHTTATESGLFDSDAWWRVINAMNLPSSGSGSRDRLVAATSTELVDHGTPQRCIQLLPFLPCIVAKLGAGGVLLVELLRPGDERLESRESGPYVISRGSGLDGVVGGVYMRVIPPAERVGHGDVVSVNGAGDTLLGAVVAGLAREDGRKSVEELLAVAQRASVRTLKSAGGVSRDIDGLREFI